MKTPSRVLVVGLGGSGLGAARLADADGAGVWVTDLRPASQLADTLDRLPARVRRFFGGHPVTCLEGVELVVTSPGVPPGAPLLEHAREREIPIVTEVEFAWQHRPEAPLAAITGSNGKSTVTVMVAEMLKASGMAAAAGGNLGTAASELVLEGGWSTWVLEVSSFQTEMLRRMRPAVAVFLNLSQDHLERHPDMDAYMRAKQQLFAFQHAADAAVLNADDPAVLATPTGGRRLLFSVEERADAWLDGEALRLGDALLTTADRVAVSGRHNLGNALAAGLAARELGASPAAIASSLGTFPGLPHRHRTVHEAHGVRWVDDSKATNVGAALAALRGYPDHSLHLILGGQAKGQDFAQLVSEARRTVVRIYLIGIDARHIAASLSGAVPMVECDTLERAVDDARREVGAGQTVLLAPACASFDQFSGYAERGDRFAALARGEVT